MGRLFGTDGVRGVYGDNLTDELAKRLGYFGTKVLSGPNHATAVLAMDTRESSPLLEQALIKGVNLAGGDVLTTGVMPTPALPVLIRDLGADFGIMVTASHNPYQFNGIKFFDRDGYKLNEDLELEIEDGVLSDEVLTDTDFVSISPVKQAKEIYLNNLLCHDHENLKGKKIVLDCSNGSYSDIAGDYFKKLGAQVVLTGAKPNGKNINDGVGSTNIEHLQKLVVDENGDFGFAFDGDGDRCLAVDEVGNIIDGDEIMFLISKKMKKQGSLKKDMLVVTTMSNIGLIKSLKKQGIHYRRTDVGDHFVLEDMLENGYNLGGEQSGHIIQLDKNTTGDGLLAASELTDIIIASGKKASELSGEMEVYPQVLVNAKVKDENKEKYLDDDEIKDHIARLEEKFKDEGRVLIRPSGTEPLVRVMIEGNDLQDIQNQAENLANLIEEKYN